MALMTATRLTKAVYSCPDVLERLAQRMPSTFLRDAVTRYDTNAVSSILEKEMCRLLGTDNLSWGLQRFCQRFGIKDDLSLMDDIDRILLIDQHRQEIDETLKNAGV